MRERGARGGRAASALRGGKRRAASDPWSLVEASCLQSMIRGRLDIQEGRLVARADEKAKGERKSRGSSGHSGDVLPLYRRPTRSRVSPELERARIVGLLPSLPPPSFSRTLRRCSLSGARLSTPYSVLNIITELVLGDTTSSRLLATSMARSQ